MAQTGPKPPRRRPDASPHHEPYPDRLHRHLTGAVDAAARVAEPVEAEPGAPTPASLVERYGAPESVNTSQNEGSDNAG